MKYTIYEYTYVGENLKTIQYFYGKTGNNDFEGQKDFKAIKQANTVKQAKKIISELEEIYIKLN